MLSKNILSVEPSLTLALNSKAIELEKQGIDIVKLTAGEPDFDTPLPIIEGAYEAMKTGKTKYTDSKGIKELREKISEYMYKRLKINYPVNNIVVTNGGKQALYNVLLAICNAGDEVIVLDPSWVSYDAQIRMVGAEPVHVPLNEEDSFLPVENTLRRYISHKTRAIIINSPNNPTGVVYNEETLKMIAGISKEFEITVISDEVYELLVYEGNHVSIATIGDMMERTVIINAFSKTWAMTGWRIGYCAGPENIMKQVAKIQSHLTSNINTPTQYGALKAFDVNVYDMWLAFKSRRDYVAGRLEKMKLNFVMPHGAFYFFINVEEFGNNDSETAEKLLNEEKLAVVPGSGFYKKGYIRISFAASEEILKKAMDRLENFVNKSRSEKLES